MRLPKSIKDNLYFMLAETGSQVGKLQVLLETASSTVAHRILDRRGYTYNLKMRIHDGCLETLRRAKKGDVDVYSLRAAEAIASNLERLTDICHDCVRLMGNLTRKDALKNRKGKKRPGAAMLGEILLGIDMIERAIEEDDTRLALKIGNIERTLEQSYGRLFRHQVKNVGKAQQAEDVITLLFIAHRIETMGDLMQDISESIISAKLGKPMQIDRFRSLEAALSDLGLMDAEVDTIAHTKSGSDISAISAAKGDANGYAAIFKDGEKGKLNEEKESVESWHEIFPGLAPQILSYKKNGKNASMLIEHLPGLTFEQVLLQESDEALEKTLKHLSKTVAAVWGETKRKKVVAAHHIAQLRKRLDGVLGVHPEFKLGAVEVEGVNVKSLQQLLDGAQKLESTIAAPFSVYIHGDFNLDNIIYDGDSKKIYFIDLHRSCYMDYVQDVAVFMVSNYRLQALDKPTRRRIEIIATQFHNFAAEFARKNGDKTFETRLALGLARSFITSTRFILDQALAKNMFLRGVYILERLQTVNAKNAKSFRLPIKELFA